MNALPDYRVIDFFDWIRKHEEHSKYGVIGFVRECVMRDKHTHSAMEDITPYVQEYIEQKKLDIAPSDLTDSIRFYLIWRNGSEKTVEKVEKSLWYEGPKREDKNNSISGNTTFLYIMTAFPGELRLQVEFLEWLLNRRLDLNDIEKMPVAVFEKMVSEYLRESTGKVDEKLLSVFIQSFKNENPERILSKLSNPAYFGLSASDISRYKSISELFGRYSNPNIYKCIILPLKDRAFEAFIYERWDDLNALSRDYLDIYYGENELFTSGYVVKEKFRLLDIREDVLPCLLLWANSIEEAKFVELRNLTYPEIFHLIQSIVQSIKEKKEFETIHREAAMMADEKRNSNKPGVTMGDGSMYFEDYHGHDFHGKTVVHKETLATASDFTTEAFEAIKKIAEANALTQEQKDALTGLISDAQKAHDDKDDSAKESCKKGFKLFLSGAGEIVKETLKTVLPTLILAFFELKK